MGNNGSSVATGSGSMLPTSMPQFSTAGDASWCNSLPGSPLRTSLSSTQSTPPPSRTQPASSRESSRPGTPREGGRHTILPPLSIPVSGGSGGRGVGSVAATLAAAGPGLQIGLPAAAPLPLATRKLALSGDSGLGSSGALNGGSFGGSGPIGDGSVCSQGGSRRKSSSSGTGLAIEVACHPAFTQPDTPGGTSHHDIFISYRHNDTSVMAKLRDVLNKNGFSVWVDESSIEAGENFISKIGEGICGSKIFMCVVTEGTYQSRYCVDELCLAYIKEKPIYAVSLCTQQDMFQRFPTSIKLIVSRFDWTTVSEENFQNDIETVLIGKLKAELDGGSPDDVSPSPISPSIAKFRRKPVMKKPHSRSRVYSRVFNRSISRGNSIVDSAEDVDCGQEFWDRNFNEQDIVPWHRFEEAFLHDYNEQLKRTYDSSDKAWFTVILKRELGVEDDMVSFEKYREFITDDDGNDRSILSCVNDLCRENLAMREVFSLDSTVRISAINDLATCHSPAVVEALLDLLNEPEHDVRASACLSLAKVKGGFETMRIDRLQRCLRDSDRFVRQAACTALGYLKAQNAIDELLRVWRNDPVTDVRQEAENALRYIGGEKVDKRFKMTTALINEILELTKLLEGPKNSSGKVGSGHAKAKPEPEAKSRTLPRTFYKVASSSDV